MKQYEAVIETLKIQLAAKQLAVIPTVKASVATTAAIFFKLFIIIPPLYLRILLAIYAEYSTNI